jgi:hypothetical protein
LPFADPKEPGEVSIACKAPAFVVEAVNFNKKRLLRQWEIFRESDFFRNPNSLKIAIVLFHAAYCSAGVVIFLNFEIGDNRNFRQRVGFYPACCPTAGYWF